MINTTELKTLDAIDLKALRQADSIVFRHKENKGYIECIKKIKNDPFEKEKRFYIEIKSSIRNSSRDKEERKYGVHVETTCKYDHELQTIIQLLKKDDTLELEFCTDYNTNQYMERANLHGDVLKLIIRRGKELEKKLSFIIASQTCEDNMARMIQRYNPHY